MEVVLPGGRVCLGTYGMERNFERVTNEWRWSEYFDFLIQFFNKKSKFAFSNILWNWVFHRGRLLNIFEHSFFHRVKTRMLRGIVEKIAFWACIVESGWKTIFHCSAHLRIYFLSHFFSLFAVSKESYISETKVTSASNFAWLWKLFVISLIYVRKNKVPKIEPCGASVGIFSQCDVSLLSVLFKVYFPK